MKRWLTKFAGAFAMATLVALTVRLCLVEDFRIVSDSMTPNLIVGDLIFVSKFDFNIHLPFSTYEVVRFRAPRRGEIVAFSLPDRGRETYIKRVVAVEGDKVGIKNGGLVVNGVEVPNQPTSDPHVRTEVVDGARYDVRATNPKTVKDYGPVDVPVGHFFVLGDNRELSNDSRGWGPIPLSCLKGKVRVVWLSIDAQGSVRKDRAGLRPNIL